MSLLRSRAVLAAGMSASLLAVLVVAESTAATTPDDTATDRSTAVSVDTVEDTGVAKAPEVSGSRTFVDG